MARAISVIQMACAAASVPVATLLARANPTVGTNVRRLLHALSTSQHEKDVAVGSLLAAEKLAKVERLSSSVALAEANGRFRLLVEGVRDHALFTMDATGRVTSWNRGAERLLGYTEAEIVGQNFSCIFTPEDIENLLPEKKLYKAQHAGQAEDEGWTVVRNGKQFWANVNITPIPEDSGMVGGFAVIVQDVTEQRKIAVLLEETRQERARLQERFLSHVSHELRTPLTAIYFFTSNLLDGVFGELTPAQHGHLALALDNIKQLKDMVSDLVDITRVETHKLTVEHQHVSPGALIAEVLSTCGTNARGKGVSLRADLPVGLPFVWADPARVRQILINLIDNGIKFTGEGGTITVGTRPVAEEGFLCISVTDTGCGIVPENLNLIFDRLAQLKNGNTASRSGLGLGLFIARALVLRHGGRIWVESEPGKGSTFLFTLRLFSLAEWSAHIFTPANLERGFVTLVAVDLVVAEGPGQAGILVEIRRLLERCIQGGQDVLLPSSGGAGPVSSFFIVACADAGGLAVIESRIDRELKNFDCEGLLKPAISSTTLFVEEGQSGEDRTAGVTAQIERVVREHLLNREKQQ